MNKLVMIAPHDKYKSYCIALSNETKATLTPLVYIQKSSFIDNKEYEKLMKEVKLAINPNYIPQTIEEGEVV